MRTLILAVLAFGLFLAPMSLTHAYAADATAKTAAATKYACPKCGALSSKPGKCAKCKVALVKANYECKMCKVGSAKPGKRPKCGMPMTKIGAK